MHGFFNAIPKSGINRANLRTESGHLSFPRGDFSMYSAIAFSGEEKENARPGDKAVRESTAGWAGFAVRRI